MKALPLFPLCLAISLLLSGAHAASVENGAGYTNNFDVRPLASDWSTRAIGSAPTDFITVEALDIAVQTNSSSLIIDQLLSAAGSPPSSAPRALWSTNGYLHMRPTTGATLLIGTFFNNTTTNAASIRIAYDYITNRAPLAAEQVRGLRVFYSLTGLENSWSNIVALSQTPEGRLSVDLPLAQPWQVGSNLYLLWADDNGSGNPDDAQNLDNFSLAVLGGSTNFSRAAPWLAQVTPPPGEVGAFDGLVITFSEPVTGVDASDLLVNGAPASSLFPHSDTSYSFGFAQPAFGPVLITWAAGHGIVDFDASPKSFDGTAPAHQLSYTRINFAAPSVATALPTRGATVTTLAQIAISFSEAVTGVDAADLLLNGAPATGVTGSDADYSFTFPQPSYGTVAVTWATTTGIQDPQGNLFQATRMTNVWNYTLVDQTSPAIASQNPPAGAHVSELPDVTVTFTEPVQGINAADLLVNGQPATAVTGSGATYTFTVPQLPVTMITVSWATNHGIQDLAPTANAFNAGAPGSTWMYSTEDNTAPSAIISPTPGATVRYLTRIAVTFDEPVTGVDAGDLLINTAPAGQVRGSGAGPYTFTFTMPPAGQVQVAFAPGHGIQDLGANAFVGGAWSYTLNPALPIDVAVTHVVQISLDGLGAKYLEAYVAKAPAQFPNFVRLMEESAFTMNARCDYDISETVPNHASMFTGRPVRQPAGEAGTIHHGYDNNFPTALETLHNSGNTSVPYKSSMFDVAHDYGRTTAFYAGKTRLAICERSYNETNGAPDVVPTAGDNGKDKIDFASVLDISGVAISNEVNMIVADLTGPAPKHYNFIHIAEPDLTGHAQNWGSAGWSNAVRMVDAQLGRIIDAIDANPLLLDQTALIVTADHGGGGVLRNGHTEAYHITNYTVPFFLRAPGIAGGSDLYALFTNRGNPGTNRTDYSTRPQPIRNSDGSNLALSLLGLPPIPGSYMVPILTGPRSTLTMARYKDRVTVFWPDPADEYALQWADALGSAWQTITSGIVTNETTKVFTVPHDQPMRYFRLRR
jgi:hypothetical protein